jgi:hypothetical protein
VTPREQRLRDAVETSVGRVVAASGSHDEQVMFEAVGECLTWLSALDELLKSRTGYVTRRDGDSKGKSLPGLRYARNQIVHGVAVVDVADVETVPTPKVIMASGAGVGSHSRIITPPARIQWTFKHTLPPPGRPAPVLEAAYAAHIAGNEVVVPIHDAVDWLDRALAMP